MTSPIGDDGDEWALDNLPVRGRSSSVFEPAPVTRSRAVAVDAGHLTAANAKNRLGIIWLFSKIYVDETPVWTLDTRVRSNTIYSAPTAWQIAADKISGLVRGLIDHIKQKLAAAMKALEDHTDEAFGAAYIGTLVVATLEEVWPAWRDWVPVAGAAAQGLAAIEQTFTAAKALFDTWLTDKCAQVVDGAPAVIVESLRNTMKRSLVDGLVTTISSGISVAGAFMTAGASTLGEMVLGAVKKLIVTVVKKYFKEKERSAMRNFCVKAEEFWVKRTDSDSIHLDHTKFVQWYKPVALAAPCIAAITLLSHIGGDKVAYLAMYQDHLATVTQSQFSNSVSALDALKPWAREFLTKAEFTFTSSDTIVSKLLGFPEVKPPEIDELDLEPALA
jgi:hypothetical protein